MFVKVCGIRSVEEAQWAYELGYDAIGLMRYPESPRFIDEETSEAIIDSVKGKILTAAVSLKLSDVRSLLWKADLIQIYEAADVPNLILAGSEPPLTDNYRYFLFDSSRGSGESENYPEWIRKYQARLIIAGGLNPENVSAVVKSFHPAGVDVSSGVESVRGKKDYSLMEYFIEEARNAVR